MPERRWLPLIGLLLLLGACQARTPQVLAGVADAPVVVVAGGDAGLLPRASAADEHLDALALAALAAEARRDGAQALLIARHGHLVLEYYSPESGAAQLVDGGEMSGALLALCVGIARASGKLLTLDLTRWNPAALQQALETETGLPYQQYLSRQLWQPMNSAAAHIVPPAGVSAGAGAGAVQADCCLMARAMDWLRVGLLLLEQGRSEGEQLVPAPWTLQMLQPLNDEPLRGFGVRLSSRRFAGRPLPELHGPGRTRLWLVPALQLAVLRVDARDAASNGNDATIFDATLRAVQDRGDANAGTSLLNQLAPGH